MAPARMLKHFSANPEAPHHDTGMGPLVQAPTTTPLSYPVARLRGVDPSPETDSSDSPQA